VTTDDFQGVTFRWGYEESFFLLAKENEKSEILKCSLFIKQKSKTLSTLNIVAIILLFMSFYKKSFY
jgi:hypothetical protein